MPPKTVVQLPVAMAHLQGVSMAIIGTAIDVHANYLPVDDQGQPVGPVRSYMQHYEGPTAKTVTDFITAVVLPEINTLEGT